MRLQKKEVVTYNDYISVKKLPKEGGNLKMSQSRNLSLTEMELDAVIHAGCFKSKEEAVNEALGTFFALRPELRLEAAVELYKEDKVTLSRAAEIAGLTIWRFKDILVNRSVSINSPSFSKEELDGQIEGVNKV